ncbi:MAG TPA: hypothetical protein VIX86_07895, partial [Streptosporangiaceae bacterium]
MMRHTHWHWFPVVAAGLLLAVTACGTTAHTPAAARTVTCPVAFPWPDRVAASAPRPVPGGLIPARPVTAVICQYPLGVPQAKAGIARRIALPAAAADGLAAVLDGAGPAPADVRRCSGLRADLPFAQVLRFGYASGRVISAAVQYSPCPVALVTVGRRAVGLPGPAKDDLFYDTSLGPASQGPRTPALIGLTAAAASATARRGHFDLLVDGGAVDPRVPFGTVIFQTDPPGWPEGSGQVNVILAVRPAPACTARQLAAGFTGAQPGAGNDMGSIVVRDIGAVPCTLPGPLRLTGLGVAGRPVTGTVSSTVAGPAVLSPGAAPVSRLGRLAPGELVGTLLLAAEYRDDPASPDGLCTAHQVAPARWRITLPAGPAITVPNAVAHWT